MAVSANIFSKCLPALGTDIKHCGSVTICDVATAGQDELNDIFQDGTGKYRFMNALLLQDFEIKACDTVQNGLYDFLMANKVDMSKRITKVNMGEGRFMIMPFIQALQESRINNEYMSVASGTVTGKAVGSDWKVTVTPQNGIPADVRWFNTKMRVFIDGVTAGGTATRTAWSVIQVDAVSGGTVPLHLKSENANSNLVAAKLEFPVTGLLYRGTPNVKDAESWCEEGPGLNTNKLVTFWTETVRNALCSSELYDKYRDAIIDNNPYYKLFADVPDVKKNAQLGKDWQSRFVNSFFYNKALVNQDENNYRSLATVTVPSGTDIDHPDQGVCVGYKANAVGVYEQLAECGRVRDLQGQVLNLQELFNELYTIQRFREGNGQPSDQIDLFTDSAFAAKIQRGMLRYFKTISEDTLRLNYDISKPPTSGKFGFRFNSYPLDYPAITLNVISHKFFDDRISAATAASATLTTSQRMVWILDFANIYPGILGSSRVVNKTGNLQEMAKVDPTYMCTMWVPSRTQTLTSVTYTAVVECPQSSLIMEGVSNAIPEHAGVSSDGVGTDLYGAY